MMKILFIDDEADNGWKQVLHTMLNKDELQVSIDSITTVESAFDKLYLEPYDLILLDLRFGEKDHSVSELKEFGGYKLLKGIRSNKWENINYTTPVMLFTASNKVWNISNLMSEGADSYYIKESPEFSIDINYTRENYERFLEEIDRLLKLSYQRKEIFGYITKIHSLLEEKHSINSNIKERILDKLMMGYGLLFRSTTNFEATEFIQKNEVLSFIAFWSILEEVSKYYFKDNWNKKKDSNEVMKGNKWILKNGKVFIEDNTIENLGIKEVSITVGIKYNRSLRFLEPDTHNISDEKEARRYTGFINLSDQIYAILLLQKGIAPELASSTFRKLNSYRNKIDFIHSSIDSIFNESLKEHKNTKGAYKSNIEMLSFLNIILG